jgi:hypothetical protein
MLGLGVVLCRRERKVVTVDVKMYETEIRERNAASWQSHGVGQRQHLHE